MHKRLLCLFGAALLTVGCNRASKSKEAVQQAITEHVTKNAGIDMGQISLELRDVKFEGDKATAAVSFKPKGSPQQGMSMSYTLERSGNKWVVKSRNSGHGGTGAAAQSAPVPGELPPGHPPSGGAASSKEALPPGHPPVNQPAPKK